uniref:Uncharacterized protein n=1 Tax=Pithovirus LCPAC403 TaxID=2506596 RepID=A0A481ZBK7_9VIRU|nr:MAG: hypothetical protein LCPAC403_01600 [Pithovirus LCPAC403]
MIETHHQDHLQEEAAELVAVEEAQVGDLAKVVLVPANVNVENQAARIAVDRAVEREARGVKVKVIVLVTRAAKVAVDRAVEREVREVKVIVLVTRAAITKAIMKAPMILLILIQMLPTVSQINRYLSFRIAVHVTHQRSKYQSFKTFALKLN